MKKQNLILLYGGRSAEREVSVLSAQSVMKAVNYDKFFVKTYFISQSGDFIHLRPKPLLIYANRCPLQP